MVSKEGFVAAVTEEGFSILTRGDVLLQRERLTLCLPTHPNGTVHFDWLIITLSAGFDNRLHNLF